MKGENSAKLIELKQDLDLDGVSGCAIDTKLCYCKSLRRWST
jgi:hypothetical protein